MLVPLQHFIPAPVVTAKAEEIAKMVTQGMKSALEDLPLEGQILKLKELIPEKFQQKDLDLLGQLQVDFNTEEGQANTNIKEDFEKKLIM